MRSARSRRRDPEDHDGLDGAESASTISRLDFLSGLDQALASCVGAEWHRLLLAPRTLGAQLTVQWETSTYMLAGARLGERFVDAAGAAPRDLHGRRGPPDDGLVRPDNRSRLARPRCGGGMGGGPRRGGRDGRGGCGLPPRPLGGGVLEQLPCREP